MFFTIILYIFHEFTTTPLHLPFKKKKIHEMTSMLFYSNHSCNITQVRTNIGLDDTLIPSSFIYFIYMGGTGPCYSIMIIFGNHVYTILNIKFDFNRMFHVLKTPVY